MKSNITPEARKVLSRWTRAGLLVYMRPLSSQLSDPENKHRLLWNILVESAQERPERSSSKAKPSKLKNINYGDLCWLTGLIDGEGTFTKYTDKRSGYTSCNIAVSMTDKDTIGKICSITGIGNILESTMDNGKPIYTWKANAQADVITLMCLLYPRLSFRRQKKIEKNLGMTPAEIRRRHELYAGNFQQWRGGGPDLSQVIMRLDTSIPDSLKKRKKAKKSAS